jgi:hypothetical protein
MEIHTHLETDEWLGVAKKNSVKLPAFVIHVRGLIA